MHVLPLDVSLPGSAEAVAAVLDALPSSVLLVDPDGMVRHANRAWTATTEALGLDQLRCTAGETDYFAMVERLGDTPVIRTFLERMQALARGELTEVRQEYSLPGASGMRSYRLHAARVDDTGRFLVAHADITARVRARRESAWLARHDPLTELPNRAFLHELLDSELRRPRRGPVSVVLVDVDGFTDVNDSLGHDAGDELLRQVAGRLGMVARDSDVLGRLGDDEFLLVSPGCPAEGAAALAERCRAALAEPVHVAGRTLRLDVSAGVATAGPRCAAVRPAELIRDADLALRDARSHGRGSVRSFVPELRSAAERRAALGSDLARAIDNGELVLHYQPILHVASRFFASAEALVRWQHPERGLLPPGEFLPVAEQYDLLGPLTRWVMREAAEQTVAWGRQGVVLVTGVNVHARHLSSGTLVGDVRSAVAAAGLDPQQFVVELTETSVAEDPACAAAQLAELRRGGVEVCIDDFGSGFSSLGQLVNLPAGVLKIDRSLVAFPEGRQEHTAAAIAAVVALGRACGMRVLAEGVETAEQLALATRLGCTLAQGYHLARPMPAAEIPDWIRAHNGDRPVPWAALIAERAATAL
ncbi:putative bifunctional diguanylate cyclase/phosphodiesterase [Blastococcus sp. SYSU D00695]